MNFESHYNVESVKEFKTLLKEDKDLDAAFVSKLVQYFEKSFPSLAKFDDDVGNELRKYVSDPKKLKALKKRIHKIVLASKTKCLTSIKDKTEDTIHPKTRKGGIKPAEEHFVSKDMVGTRNVNSDSVKKETDYGYAANSTTNQPTKVQETKEVPEFDANTFFARWFMSKKELIPKEWFEYLAKEYPYSGRAFRLAKTPTGKPYTSWCKTLDGLTEWKAHMPDNPLAKTPEGWYNYRGTIAKGIDIAEFAKENIKNDSGKLLVDVEEVAPIEPMTNIVKIV